jgi:hypothetical protein
MKISSRSLLPYLLVSLIVAGFGIRFLLPEAVWRAPKVSDNSNTAPQRVFDGDSQKLAATVVVPTLDTPVPGGKNAIWCASFQIAWDRLKNDVAGEAIQVATAEAAAARLNAGELPPDAIDEASCYATAGRVKDGIRERIRADMQKRFQKAAIEFGSADSAVVAYAYLQTRILFTIPYFENNEPLEFIGGDGKVTAVSSFGLGHKQVGRYLKLHDQPELLYVNLNHEPGQWKPPTEFVLDLCHDSTPNQVIVARIPRKETLKETLDDLKRRLTKPPSKEYRNAVSVLLVPNLNWNIRHRFGELEGSDKRLLNSKLQGLYVSDAIQTVDFHLDRSGVELRSEAGTAAASASFGNCLFDHPFLILVKKRGAESPMLVIWVDNAELLCIAK